MILTWAVVALVFFLMATLLATADGALLATGHAAPRRIIGDPEITGIQRRNPIHLVFGQIRAFRSGRKFCKLLFIIDVWKRRGDTRIFQQPEQCGLPQGPVGSFQEPKLFDFFNTFDQP